MPPKKKGAKRQRGGAAAAPAAAPAAPSLATLPQEVIELIGDHLLEQGKLNNIETSVYDLAALAQCST